MNSAKIGEVEVFTYLSAKISTTGDSEVEIHARLSKASQKAVEKKDHQHKDLRIFKSNVLSTLLYGSDSWKMTNGISKKLEVFQNRCLRRI